MLEMLSLWLPMLLIDPGLPYMPHLQRNRYFHSAICNVATMRRTRDHVIIGMILDHELVCL